MKKFNHLIAFERIHQLCSDWRIKINGWNYTPTGLAWVDKRKIQIPYPNTIIDFAVAMHEVGHVTLGNIKPRYLEEYKAEMFAIEQVEEMGWDATVYIETARRYTIMNIAVAFNNGLLLHTIPKEVVDFCNTDFREWLWVGGLIKVQNWEVQKVHLPLIINNTEIDEPYLVIRKAAKSKNKC